ncbi:alpha/beta hydrolase related protein [Streptococcus pneumoniae]|uniref:alpha/beta hydrolase n=1 Tax=Streptococcus pneumoniae TaxID=1313 RepID=UPI000768A360|nr:alpha/beta hydrolase [Streptococcus pneumoniae]MDG9597762.1 alpha/beta hydrolase [Streptococcus pneumoniae]MDG9599714.1 alpha/beta hydrolase [Streptococcus pneumoniae]MDG9605610.1 alpha/beta hydrolase [Streptococcus pneumoniae]MDS2967679.1 alpha/beta hydrolase [Streptococcus pneumoniae]MDS3751779.1 alpha/beta hydrolase [Streptococcus pneumoniae]
MKKYFISGLGSNAYHSEEESICLIGHSLGGDLARYFASEFEEVKKLILLDGGYLDLDKILPLDTELEETKNYIKSQIVSDLDVLTSKEKSEAKHWSENMEKAVRQSYHWNVEYNRYELAINYENIEAILRLRRKIQAFKREVGDTLFISPRYSNEATWREEALKELPDYFDTIFLENFGHELYTQAPKEIASLMNEWLAYFL